MEASPNSRVSMEDYRNLLKVNLVGIKKNQLRDEPSTYRFAVSSGFDIFLTDAKHYSLEEKGLVLLEESLTEGYLDTQDDRYLVEFKPTFYQSRPAFRGSGEELRNLKLAVESKLIDFLAS